MSTQASSERSIFESAIDISSPAARAAFLEQACAGNPRLRADVDALLAAHDRLAGAPAAGPAPPPAATVAESSAEGCGTVIGPYKLMEQIGEGGMGLVFVAEQQQPIRRKVALKVIKPGMDTRQVVARFEAERQALALMDHPNIAQVHDGGATASGRPYFVMELVKGVPITQFCDQNQVAVRARLELFVHVCQAIQHAHQKGIIHRDIKPSNVLVLSQDGTPVVKVIDFGVAKAIGQQLTEKTLYTHFSQLVGTPLYMSPEQAGQSGVDVDTRSDIYALGVLLYELLTGTTPFDQERLKTVGFDEICRILREEEPPKPSTRISTLGQAEATVSANRQSDPKRLRQLVRGELDWIVMKALEKDRNRRYDTASAFATDVQRYLAEEPVQAGPPSGWYRLRKFGRRNRAPLGLAAAVLALALGLAGSAVWFASQRAARQVETERVVTAALAQAETLVSEGDKESDHPERWQATARLAQAAVEKAEDVLAAGLATPALSARVRQVRAAVDAAVTDSRLLVQLDRVRLEQATVKDGHFDDARAAPLYAELLGGYGVNPAEPERAAARVRDSRLREALLSALAEWQRVTQDQGERQRVANVYQLVVPPDALRSRLRAAVRGRDSATLVRLMQEPAFRDLPPATLVGLAIELVAMKEWTAAERLLRAGLERYPGDFWLNHNLGRVLQEQTPSRPEEAVRYLTAALALRYDSPGVYLNLGVALAATHDGEAAIRCYRTALQIDPKYAMAHNNLGYALKDQGQLDEAIAEFREAIRLKKDFPMAHNNLGNALQAQGRLDEAIDAYREAIRLKKDYPEAHTNLGSTLAAQGRVDEAIAAYKEALRLKPDYASAHYNLGNALKDQGQLDEAIAAYREALRIKPDKAEAHCNLGLALQAQGRLDEAIAAYGEAIASKKGFPQAYKAHYNLGNALHDQGRLDEAIAAYREAIQLKKDYADAHHNLGGALNDKGQLDEAIAEFREAIRLNKDDPGAHYNLGHALKAQGRLDEAIAAYREAIRLKKDFADAHNNLGLALADQGRLDEAIAEYREAIRLKKDNPLAHYNLGNALADKGKLDEAIAAYREALRLKKDDPVVHFNLGIALADQGQLDEAIAAYREAIRLKKDYYQAHGNLGLALQARGQLDEAISEYQEAIRIKKDDALAHYNLGNALKDKGQLDGAIACWRQAIALDPKHAPAHTNLGAALAAKGQMEEAIAAFRAAIRLKPDYAEAHYNLGRALQQQGAFRQALEALRRGHELGSKNARWPYPSAQLVRQCERLVELDGQLPGFLAGQRTPASPAERLELGGLCTLKRLNHAAARFYADAFAAQTKLAEDLGAHHRYDAACAAALAGCGQGKDANKLDEPERARLRRQAVTWLQADLAAWRTRLEKDPNKAGPDVLQTMQHWQGDTDFAGVRGPEALARLPEAERPVWQKLWQEVAALQQRAAGSK
jgi:tetratricopeptide (TPR) repeat protein/serine/threonine protein kinase